MIASSAPSRSDGADGVHGHVAATDDGHAVAVQHRRVRGLPVGAHEVDAGEVLVGGVDALEVLAGHVHEHRQARADGDEDRRRTWSRSSRSVQVLPTMALTSISTPSALRRSISAWTMSLGSRNSGMP